MADWEIAEHWLSRLHLLHWLVLAAIASRSYLSEIESGGKEPTLQLVLRYAEVFKIPASSILFFSENFDHPGAHQGARRLVAGKVLALMRFLEARSNGGAHAD
jgi:transcriptional regulator with XRE-family HTH domain